jgi:ferredoxin
MSRPRWFVSLLKRAFPGRFLAARTTHWPVVGSVVDRWLFGGDELYYLPKDGVIHIGESIETAEEMVLPSQVVEHFVLEANTHWIMNHCICREGAGCQDYPVDLGCLFLGEAAAGINPKLGRRVSREEALQHVQRCRDAGLVHLIGRNKLDTLWLGVGPGDRLLTICNCCPCCCLWRVLPHVAPQIGAKVQRMPGVTVSVGDGCTGCGRCTEVCFVEAIELVDGRPVITEACRGCGRCVEACPQGAIEISVEDRDYVTSMVARIAPLVDVG